MQRRPSLSQKCSQLALLTKLPLQLCESSCAITSMFSRSYTNAISKELRIHEMSNRASTSGSRLEFGFRIVERGIYYVCFYQMIGFHIMPGSA